MEFPKIPLESDDLKEEPEDLTQYIYGNTTYFFSKEMQQGLRGERPSDHKVLLKVLQKCLEKKHRAIVKQAKKALKNQEKNPVVLDFYFVEGDPQGHKIVNLVVKFFPAQQSPGDRPVFTVITAYYPARNVIFDRFNFTEVRYESWKSQLPNV